MCLPAILFFLFMSYAPMPGAYVAFTNFNYNAGIFGSEFVGWQNFEFLFSSGTLLMLLRNTILYNLVFIVLGNIIQVFLAILLNEVACKRCTVPDVPAVLHFRCSHRLVSIQHAQCRLRFYPQSDQKHGRRNVFRLF